MERTYALFPSGNTDESTNMGHFARYSDLVPKNMGFRACVNSARSRQAELALIDYALFSSTKRTRGAHMP
jgi:catalase (peroxidase I)